MTFVGSFWSISGHGPLGKRKGNRGKRTPCVLFVDTHFQVGLKGAQEDINNFVCAFISIHTHTC